MWDSWVRVKRLITRSRGSRMNIVLLDSVSHGSEGDAMGSDGWLHTLCVALQLRSNKLGEFTKSKRTFCPGERCYLISQGCLVQTQLWEMAQVKCSQGPAFSAYPARCVEVQETHAGLSLPTVSLLDFTLSWLLANFHMNVQLHWLLGLTWLRQGPSLFSLSHTTFN